MVNLQEIPKRSKEKFEPVYPGYAYELLELQMDVEDQKIDSNPSIESISKLVRLYMVGVQILERENDIRYTFFANKLNRLITKRHIVKKLHESAGNDLKDISFTQVKKSELKDKKEQYEMQRFLINQEADIKRVKEMLSSAYTNQVNIEGKIKSDIRTQENKLLERINRRRLRSEGKRRRQMQVSPDTPNPDEELSPEPRTWLFPLTGIISKFVSREYRKVVDTFGFKGRSPPKRDKK